MTAEDLCFFNSEVAARAGVKHLGIIWNMIGNMLSNGDGSNSDDDSSSESEESESEDSERENGSDDDNVGSEEDEGTVGEGGIGGMKPYVSTSTALALLSPTKKSQQEGKTPTLSRSESKRVEASDVGLSAVAWMLEKVCSVSCVYLFLVDVYLNLNLTLSCLFLLFFSSFFCQVCASVVGGALYSWRCANMCSCVFSA